MVHFFVVSCAFLWPNHPDQSSSRSSALAALFAVGLASWQVLSWPKADDLRALR